MQTWFEKRLKQHQREVILKQSVKLKIHMKSDCSEQGHPTKTTTTVGKLRNRNLNDELLQPLKFSKKPSYYKNYLGTKQSQICVTESQTKHYSFWEKMKYGQEKRN